jgi:hypothetical protein
VSQKDSNSDTSLLWLVVIILSFSHCGANEDIGKLTLRVNDLESQVQNNKREESP